MSVAGIRAVDLFAGTGWAIAAKRLGIVESGVEKMPEARAVREANGMHNWLDDVWEVLEHAPVESPEFKAALLIASPPCQTFSMAGRGKGREALDEVLGLIDSRAYLDPARLREFGERHDPRTALVLTPLTYVARHTPMYVVLEQVPPVLPVWERMAVELRGWGYSVWCGILHAEQYGVPQTRTRAVLIARNDGVEAAPPPPTHSRYYNRTPDKLDADVRKWVSMAEALGWGDHEITPVNGNQAHAARRSSKHPQPTMHFGHALNDVRLYTAQNSRQTRAPGDTKRYSKSVDAPAPTVMSSSRSWYVQERHRGAGQNERSGKRRGRPIDEPALTVTGSASGTTPGGFRVVNLDPSLPATIVPGRGIIGSRDHHEGREEHNASSTKITLDEAATLQSYPAGFQFEGVSYVDDRGKPCTVSLTNAFLQVGNAVPPLLAEAVLGVFA